MTPRRNTIDGSIHIEESRVPPGLLNRLRIHHHGVETLLYDTDSEGMVALPWGAYDSLRDAGMALVDRRTSPAMTCEAASLFQPRQGQYEAVDAVLQGLRAKSHGILLAACGAGKTVMGAEVALRLRRKTCVLVHKEFLADQWEAAFNMLCPGISIGRFQQDQQDSGLTHDVVIALVQSLTSPKRMFPEGYFDTFGLLLGDELHRYGAETWKKTIQLFPARYRLGVTATPHRSDGLWPLLEANFGEVLHQFRSPGLRPRVYRVTTDVDLDPLLYSQRWLDQMGQRARLLSLLAALEGRNEVLCRNVAKAVRAGRKVLIVSERKAQLQALRKMVIEAGIEKDEVGLFVGGLKKEQLDAALSCRAIFATYQMAKEGLDIPDLDSLVMATPQFSVEQTIGRILRLFEGKAAPLVVDFVDAKIPLLYDMGMARLRQYSRLGYEVL